MTTGEEWTLLWRNYTYVFFNAACQIDDRNVWSRNTECHSRQLPNIYFFCITKISMVSKASTPPRTQNQLPIQIRNDLAYGFGSTGGGRDDVLVGTTTITPKLKNSHKNKFLLRVESRLISYSSLTFELGPSTVFWVAVTACTVVISPSMISKLSWITFASGARQFVVQEALLTTVMLGS